MQRLITESMSSSNDSPLFFHDGFTELTAEVVVTGGEAGHILRSRRLEKGDQIRLTDGRGALAEGRLVNVSPKLKDLTVKLDSVVIVPVLPTKLVLVSALPKGDRQSTMLDMSTQMGMTRFIPLRCEHSAVFFQPKMKLRWEKIIKESCKQCRQVHFPLIRDEIRLYDLVLNSSGRSILVYADYNGMSVQQFRDYANHDIDEMFLLVGPEGGFSRKEIDWLRENNALALKLGDQILRTETAAVALFSAVNQII